ncbi:CPBP family glutamic-type intramembrane protease [Ferviditalea candida]|uniref:CPBP family intramembrane glutamic endopeptidase n=1 Tax=Ferviditalea candida TaxID=3108399 RepID=A0ABU5ZCF5_9BACL|nr:CPBP family intramembrane glutamic endopeptidase [Paenibacillaceae bacterium T2]
MQTLLKQAFVVLLKLILIFVLIVLVSLILAVLLLAVYFSSGRAVGWERLFGDPRFVDAMLLAQMAAFVISTFVMHAWFERKKWPLGWKREDSLPDTFKGMLMGIVLMTASSLLIVLFGGVTVTGWAIDMETAFSLLKGAVLFLLVALNEELFSRGYVQGLFRYHFGSAPGIAAASLLFALLHFFNPGVVENAVPMVNLALAGILLGLSREMSGGLWMPVGIHLTWNYFQGNIFGFPVSGVDVKSLFLIEQSGHPLISGGAFGAEGSVVTSFVLSAGILWIIWRHRKFPGKGSWKKTQLKENFTAR